MFWLLFVNTKYKLCKYKLKVSHFEESTKLHCKTGDWYRSPDDRFATVSTFFANKDEPISQSSR